VRPLNKTKGCLIANFATVPEIDTGEGKQGEDTESKISVVCTYFRLTMDGKELVEIDTINMIEKVNGVDRLEQHRRNIGL
ncbi:phage major tail tube protein, partial [Escherichia coli]|nr:phage major tail tube protein [Escherichia coli]HCX6115682.1 phage major tail tube protein [Escherichia coli]